MADIVKKKIKLDFPVQFGSELVQELEFETPRVKHIRGIPDPDTTDGQLEVISRLIGKPPAFIDEIHMKDMKRVNDFVNSFLSDSPIGK